MNRFTLKNRVVSGFVCLSLAVAGTFLSGGDLPVIHDGNAPRTAAVESQHLDEFKMSNPVLDEFKMSNPVLNSLDL